MKLPNTVSVAVIVGIIALCQGLAETLPVLGAPWVPFAIVALAALVKGLQVYLQEKPTNGEIRSAAERKQHGVIRQTLLG
jgi:hypothetical protein